MSATASQPRVSNPTATLLSMLGDIDGYWSRHEFSQLFNQCQMMVPDEERSALMLILRGVQRLFPFDPSRDMPDQMVPKHAV